MKDINFPLLLGSIILILLILVAFYPGVFTANDPLFEEAPKYIEYKENGEWIEKFSHNPMPPNKANKLGTDDAGRDVYARLVYGTRNTLKLALLIAVFRMIIALPLGLAAGMGLRFISNIIKVFNTYFTAIPMLIFSYIILNIGYFRMLQMDRSILAFAVVLTIVGWPKLAGIIEDSAKRVMEEDFIEGEIAIGKTKFQIAYQNVLPHLIPTSISLFFKEMGMGLFLIAQLAVLYVFVGVTRQINTLAFKANYLMILEPEWGGTLSRIAVDAKKYNTVYWMSIYPILVFTIAIIGINLTGEGLRIEFQKRESRVISSIRKLFYIVSPRLFMSQIKDFKKYYKSIIIKASIIVGIVGYFLIPWSPSLYEFDINQAKLHIEELTNNKYEGRVTGTEGGYLAGEYIIDTLKSYGYQVDTMEIPLTDIYKNLDTEKEMIIPKVLTPLQIDSGWIKVIDENGEEKMYYLYKDFIIGTVGKDIFIDSVFEENPKELNFKGIAASVDNAERISEGTEFFPISPSTYGFTFRNAKESNKIRGVKKTFEYNIEFLLKEYLVKNTNPYFFKSTAIIPFNDLRIDLESGYKEVEINFSFPKIPEYPGRNITAFLPGKGKTIEDPRELIIIGASYDGLHLKGTDNSYAMTATPTAVALELARNLSLLEEQLEKSIQFIFWDNEFDTTAYSELKGSYYYNLIEKKSIDLSLAHGYYYFDISYPGNKQDEFLNLITFPAQRGDKSNYLMGMAMEKRLKQKNAKYKRYYYEYLVTDALRLMRLNALSSVGVGNPSTGGINSIEDTLEMINYERIESMGQLLLDTMTMNSYIME